MRLPSLLAAAAAADLAVAPAAATPAAPPAEPAPETVSGSALRSGNAVFILPLLVVIALLVAISKDDDTPTSP